MFRPGRFAVPPLLAALPLLALLHAGCGLDEDGETDTPEPFLQVETIPNPVSDSAPMNLPLNYIVPFVLPSEEQGDSAYVDRKTSHPVGAHTSSICVTALKPYHAKFVLTDAAGRILLQSETDFGKHGEFNNVRRIRPNGLIGCLEWIGAFTAGKYAWNSEFRFEGHPSLIKRKHDFQVAPRPAPRQAGG